jgi:hypothetical protein
MQLTECISKHQALRYWINNIKQSASQLREQITCHLGQVTVSIKNSAAALMTASCRGTFRKKANVESGDDRG